MNHLEHTGSLKIHEGKIVKVHVTEQLEPIERQHIEAKLRDLQDEVRTLAKHIEQVNQDLVKYDELQTELGARL